MAGPSNVLLREGFAKWFRTKGFLMVLAVGLIPPALTAAWVGTHDADIAVVSLDWAEEAVTAGDNVTFRATVRNVHDSDVGGFNTTIRVGYYERAFSGEIRWRDVHNETMQVDGLVAGASTTVTTTWTTRAGSYQVEAFADVFEEDIPEIEELNNYRPAQLQVAYESVRPQVSAPPPANNTTDASRPDVELNVTKVEWTPHDIFEEDNVTFTVTVANEGPEAVQNASLQFQVFQIGPTGQITSVALDETTNVSQDAGTTTTHAFVARELPRGLFAAFAFLDASAASSTDNETNNVVVQQFDVQRRLVWEEPPEKATAKAFYRSEVLLPLHYTLLVPLIGLFFAGGVLHDERQRGNLVYLLTRPVPRWSLPLTRFASGFGVALIAVLVGVVLTWLLLLGTPQDASGFLWWPLVFAAVVLLLYSAVFTFVGVVSDRPYLVGLLYILGFETLVLAGRRVLVNGNPLVQDWLLNFSLLHWVSEAFAGWDPASGSLLPQGDAAVTAFVVIGGIIIASLVGAVLAATRREIPT